MHGTYQFTEQRNRFIYGGSGLQPRPSGRLPCLSPSLISSVSTRNYRRGNANHNMDASFQIRYNSLFSKLYSDNLVVLYCTEIQHTAGLDTKLIQTV